VVYYFNYFFPGGVKGGPEFAIYSTPFSVICVHPRFNVVFIGG